MKTFPVTLILIAAIGTFGIAVLTETISVVPQPVTTFASVDDLENNPVCNCENPDDPDDFGPEFCDRLSSIDKSPICNTADDMAIYPILVEESIIEGEGCDARFWKAVNDFGYVEVHAWPATYNADQRFNEVFYTNVKFSDVSIEELDVIPFDFLVDEDKKDILTTDSSNIDRNTNEEKTNSGNEATNDKDEKLKQISKKEDKLGPTLIDALYLHPESYSSEGKDDMVREAVAALLNAAHHDVDYPYSERDVISLTQEAMSGGDYSEILHEFKTYNNLQASNICP